MVLSAVIGVISTALIIAAIVSPNWVMYSSGEQDGNFQGLFVSCVGEACTTNQFAANGQGPFGNFGCNRNGAELNDRFNATAALLIVGVILTFAVMVFQFVQIVGLARISDSGHMWLAWTLVLAFVLTMIGVAIFGGTVNSWWNCGSDFCEPYQSTSTGCGVGYSFVFATVGSGTLLVAALLVMVYTKFPHVMYPTADIVLFVALLEIFSVVTLCVGIATPQWQVVVPVYQSIGLFETCSSSSCSVSLYPTTINTRTNCNVNGTALQARYAVAAAFLIFAGVISLVLTIIFFLAHFKVPRMMFTSGKKKAIIASIVSSIAAMMIAIIVAANAIESFYFCGISYCTAYTGYCSWGPGFGCAVAAICLEGFLLAMHWFEYKDWCCFQERFASGRQAFSIRKVLEGTRKKNPAPVTAVEPLEEAVTLPTGQWDYDSVSGFYWSEELYLFYDPTTQQFYDPNKDEWFTQDARTAALLRRGTELSSTSKPVTPRRAPSGAAASGHRSTRT
jgi:hypothetical protein